MKKIVCMLLTMFHIHMMPNRALTLSTFMKILGSSERVVALSTLINKAGKAEDVRIEQSSGDDNFDKEAVADTQNAEHSEECRGKRLLLIVADRKKK